MVTKSELVVETDRCLSVIGWLTLVYVYTGPLSVFEVGDAKPTRKGVSPQKVRLGFL